MSPSFCEGRFASFAAPPRAVHERPLRFAFPLLFLGALKWPLSGWLLPLRLFRGAGRSSSSGFGYVAI